VRQAFVHLSFQPPRGFLLLLVAVEARRSAIVEIFAMTLPSNFCGILAAVLAKNVGRIAILTEAVGIIVAINQAVAFVTTDHAHCRTLHILKSNFVSSVGNWTLAVGGGFIVPVWVLK
jgi:hypothetical protein